ncbi:MAG TPA: hypothetical protein VJ826_16285 [Candidatus Polarisedimenticolaceae bacterium]|nr:hypothetical protein [Candidatus Polarisedimenticolaceae bacterium]
MRRLAPVLLAACFGVTGTLWALPPVVVEHRVSLTVETLLVDRDDTRRIGEPVSLEIGPDAEQKAGFSVPWGSAGPPASVVLIATLGPGSGDSPPTVRCTATVEVPGGTRRVSDRVVEGEGTALFEILDGGGRRIVLALKTEPVDRPVVHRFAKVGAPVRFLVAVERVDGDKAVVLETNHLNTFVGQSVGYSFHLGQEDVRLELLPVSLLSDILTIQASISGSLPGAGVTSLVSRQERIVASRMTTSAISATAGSPPSGYRFQVTPDF